MRRAILALAAFTLGTATASADDLAARARKLHRAAIIVNTHIDTPDVLSEKWKDLKLRGATGHFDIPRAREGGLGAAFFSIYVASSFADKGTAAGRALELIDLTQRVVRENPKDLVLAASVADIRPPRRPARSRSSWASRAAMRSRTTSGRCGVPSPRRALRDPHAHQHQRLGRLLGAVLPPRLRSQDRRQTRRPQRPRPQHGEGDEPHRHDRGRLARLRRHHRRRARDLNGAGDGLALVVRAISATCRATSPTRRSRPSPTRAGW